MVAKLRLLEGPDALGGIYEVIRPAFVEEPDLPPGCQRRETARGRRIIVTTGQGMCALLDWLASHHGVNATVIMPRCRSCSQ